MPSPPDDKENLRATHWTRLCKIVSSGWANSRGPARRVRGSGGTAGSGGAAGTTGSGGAAGSSGAPGPCDIYQSAGTPCVAAHSTVRALYAAYKGALYQVRRASDSSTKDVPVLAAGGFADV